MDWFDFFLGNEFIWTIILLEDGSGTSWLEVDCIKNSVAAASIVDYIENVVDSTIVVNIAFEVANIA